MTDATRSQAEAAPILQVEALGKRVRLPAGELTILEGVGFEVARGDTVAIVGASGSGKSTLLSLMAGVLRADAGTVALLGEPWERLSSARRDRRRADHLGYIFQQFNLLPYLSVLDNVRLPCRFSNRRAERTRDGDAERLLQRSGLAKALWSRPASALSVGQQQRVAAARALIGQPDLVVADEPTSALDEDLRESFMALLLDSCSEAGSALVFVSHDSRLAAHFDRQLDLPALNHAAASSNTAEAAA